MQGCCRPRGPFPPYVALIMKIYVHLDEDSISASLHTKIDDASPLSVAAVIEHFSSAYASRHLQNSFSATNNHH